MVMYVYAGPIWYPGDFPFTQAFALVGLPFLFRFGTVRRFSRVILFGSSFSLSCSSSWKGCTGRNCWRILVSGIIGALALIPLAEHLPYPFQRTLSVLPYKVSNAARLDAQASSEWRLQMWQALLPQIPAIPSPRQGYVISPLDYDFVMGPEASVHYTFAENEASALAEDFHSGPISVVIPFGIWGCLALLWFLVAGTGCFTATIVTAIRR